MSTSYDPYIHAVQLADENARMQRRMNLAGGGGKNMLTATYLSYGKKQTQNVTAFDGFEKGVQHAYNNHIRNRYDRVFYRP